MAELDSSCASASSCDRSSCEGCPSKSASPASGASPFAVDENPYSHIKHVIGIVSGKGGVGKSFVTASIATAMAKEGYKVGIMDADITGPSIPKMYGVKGPALGNETGTFASESRGGIKMMSINLLLEDEETPVVWRGPVIAGTVKQFYSDIIWGELDYLFVDMPPGTGDVPLTVFQSLPVDGIIIVTSPQELVSLIVKKARNMANEMDIPILGVVENYSYVQCPNCSERIYIYGKTDPKQLSDEMGLDVLGQIPMNAEFARCADSGSMDDIENEHISALVEKLKA